jgi:hypothetical protein
MQINSSDQIQFVVSDGTNFSSVTTITTITDSNWHHVAAVRTGNVLKVFIDGTQSGGDTAFTGTVPASTNVFRIGTNGEIGSTSFEEDLDDFRLSVGIARWAANFTPPTAELTKVLVMPAVRGVFTLSGLAAIFHVSLTWPVLGTNYSYHGHKVPLLRTLFPGRVRRWLSRAEPVLSRFRRINPTLED